MPRRLVTRSWFILAAGLAAGLMIAFVDNFAFEVEVSPIIIAALLAGATAAAGAVWGRRGWFAALGWQRQ